MALELQIFSPSEDGYIKEIRWNYDDLKTAIAAKVEDYKGLTYTDEQMTEAKKDRAELNRFRSALDAKRKEIKKRCLAPYETFEAQMKELTHLVDEPIGMIDSQLAEYDNRLRAEKETQIEALFEAAQFQPFVTLDRIKDPRWLNRSYSLKQVEQDMHARKEQISNDVYLINKLPESKAALVIYEQTLNIRAAQAEAERMAQVQREAWMPSSTRTRRQRNRQNRRRRHSPHRKTSRSRRKRWPDSGSQSRPENRSIRSLISFSRSSKKRASGPALTKRRSSHGSKKRITAAEIGSSDDL